MNNADARHLEAAIDEALAEGSFASADALVAQYRREAAHTSAAVELARSLPFRAEYFAGVVALASGQLRRSLERFEPLLTQVARLPEELAGRLRLLTAEAHGRLRHGDQARALLAQVSLPLLEREPLLRLR